VGGRVEGEWFILFGAEAGQQGPSKSRRINRLAERERCGASRACAANATPGPSRAGGADAQGPTAAAKPGRRHLPWRKPADARCADWHPLPSGPGRRPELTSSAEALPGRGVADPGRSHANGRTGNAGQADLEKPQQQAANRLCHGVPATSSRCD